MKIFAPAILASSYLVVAGAGVVQAETGATASTEIILERMSEARAENRARLRPFEVTRTYELFGKERGKTQSEVTADISYAPNGIQHYTIRRLFGVPIGETLVRKILESENEVLSNRDAFALSEENYLFRYAGTEDLNGRLCYLLALHPKRKDGKLIVGTAWIDAATYLVRKVEGEPAQSSSWWIHNIRITLDFRDIHGMWLQTALSSTADVRFLGPHTMLSHDVEYRMGAMQAGITPAKTNE